MANNMRMRDRQSERNKTISGSISHSSVQDLIKVFEGGVTEVKKESKLDNKTIGRSEELIIENCYNQDDLTELRLSKVERMPTFEQRKAFFETNLKIYGITCPFPDSTIKTGKKEAGVSQIVNRLNSLGLDKCSVMTSKNKFQNTSGIHGASEKISVMNNKNINSLSELESRTNKMSFNNQKKSVFESKIRKPTYFPELSTNDSFNLHNSCTNIRPSINYLDRFKAIDKHYTRDIKETSDQLLTLEKQSKYYQQNTFNERENINNIKPILMNDIDFYSNQSAKCLETTEDNLNDSYAKFTVNLPDLDKRTFNYNEILKIFEPETIL